MYVLFEMQALSAHEFWPIVLKPTKQHCQDWVQGGAAQAANRLCRNAHVLTRGPKDELHQSAAFPFAAQSRVGKRAVSGVDLQQIKIWPCKTGLCYVPELNLRLGWAETQFLWQASWPLGFCRGRKGSHSNQMLFCTQYIMISSLLSLLQILVCMRYRFPPVNK